MANSRSLPELAHIISTRANSIYDAYDAADLSQPSFDYGTTHYGGPFTRPIEDSRSQLLEALDELRSLILGPAGHIFFLSFMTPAFTATLHILYKFEIPRHVPISEPISYPDLATRCGLTESQTRRYVRAAISLHIFIEPTPDTVHHNAASATLATTTLHDWIGMATEELAPAALKVGESLEKYPEADEPTKSAFAMANGSNGDQDLFAIVVDQPGRMARFANAMAWSMKVPGMEPRYTVDNLGWSSSASPEKGWCPKVIVDVGGGTGTLCKAILQSYPRIEKAFVQDLPDVVTQAQADIPGEFDGRLEFQAYSFFTEQTIKDADVYIYRCVFHDWPDSYAINILKNQIPALKPGARILLNERCLEAPKRDSHVKDQFAASCDILMQLCANAKERTRADWTALFAAADPRFKIEGVISPPHSALSVIEVVWAGAEDLNAVNENGNGVIQDPKNNTNGTNGLSADGLNIVNGLEGTKSLNGTNGLMASAVKAI